MSQGGPEMNKKMVLAGLFVLIFAVSVSFGQAQKAVHITQGQCGLLDGDGNVVVTDDVKIVITNSANGNVILKCKAQGVDNNQGTAVHWDAYDNPQVWSQKAADPSPLPCVGTAGGSAALLTQDWQIVVSEKGNAMMTCRFKVSDE